MVCGLLHVLIALKLRPALTKDSKEVYSFLLGKIPSFLTVFSLYFFITFFTKKKRLGILVGIYIGSLIQELQQLKYNVSDSGIVGRTFDYYDIAFLTLGALAAFLLERWMNRKQNPSLLSL